VLRGNRKRGIVDGDSPPELQRQREQLRALPSAAAHGAPAATTVAKEG